MSIGALYHLYIYHVDCDIRGNIPLSARVVKSLLICVSDDSVRVCVTSGTDADTVRGEALVNNTIDVAENAVLGCIRFCIS